MLLLYGNLITDCHILLLVAIFYNWLLHFITVAILTREERAIKAEDNDYKK